MKRWHGLKRIAGINTLNIMRTIKPLSLQSNYTDPQGEITTQPPMIRKLTLLLLFVNIDLFY